MARGAAPQPADHIASTSTMRTKGMGGAYRFRALGNDAEHWPWLGMAANRPAAIATPPAARHNRSLRTSAPSPGVQRDEIPRDFGFACPILADRPRSRAARALARRAGRRRFLAALGGRA